MPANLGQAVIQSQAIEWSLIYMQTLITTPLHRCRWKSFVYLTVTFEKTFKITTLHFQTTGCVDQSLSLKNSIFLVYVQAPFMSSL